jgi:hypothetical protein
MNIVLFIFSTSKEAGRMKCKLTSARPIRRTTKAAFISLVEKYITRIIAYLSRSSRIYLLYNLLW